MNEPIRMSTTTFYLEGLLNKLKIEEGDKLNDLSRYEVSIIGDKEILDTFNMLIIEAYLKKGKCPPNAKIMSYLLKAQTILLKPVKPYDSLKKEKIKASRKKVLSSIKKKFEVGELFNVTNIISLNKELNYTEVQTILRLLEAKEKIISNYVEDPIVGETQVFCLNHNSTKGKK